MQSDIDQQLAAMAQDPAIQQEIRDIQDEFSVTEADGLHFLND